MNLFFDVTWQLYNIFLVVFLIVLAALILRFLLKNKIHFFVAVGIVSVGAVFLAYQMNHTTFQAVVSDHLHENSTVRNISISTNDLTGDFPEREARATIEDEAIIEKILEDFSEIELRTSNHSRGLKDYSIHITITNEVKDNYLVTNTLTLEMDDTYLDQYEIISDTNHLQTIESLVEREEVDWQKYNE